MSNFCLGSPQFVGVFIEYSVRVIYPRRADSIRPFKIYSHQIVGTISLTPSLPTSSVVSSYHLSLSLFIISHMLFLLSFFVSSPASLYQSVSTNNIEDPRRCQHRTRITLSSVRIMFYFDYL